MPLYSTSIALKLLTNLRSAVEVPAQSQKAHQYLNATTAATKHPKYPSGVPEWRFISSYTNQNTRFLVAPKVSE